MDQLEEQVSDLRSFLGAAQAPQGPEVVLPHNIAYSDGPLHASSHATTALSAPGDNSAQSPSPLDSQTTTSKRRAEDGDVDGPAAKQQRSKRNRYISIACNECKRRKIKCNGQTPCQRCGHLNLQCLYAPNCCANFKDSDEFKQVTDQVKQLQDHVDTLYNNMNALRQETVRLAPLLDRVLPPPSNTVTPSPTASSTLPSLSKTPLLYRVPSAFNGPMSHAYTVNVAKNTLHTMGVADGNSDDDAAPQQESSNRASPEPPSAVAPSVEQANLDPLWELDEAEMMRLLKVFNEEVGVMYPLIPASELLEQAKKVAAWMDAVRRNPYLLQDQEKMMTDYNTVLLKVVLCTALTVDENGNSPRAERIFETVTTIINRMLVSDPPSVKTIALFANVAGYRYLSNDEILGWRVTGITARMCFELGLHRRDGLAKIKDYETRQNAIHAFWANYIMDRRWSFSNGLPFVCHDEVIDPKLPYPDKNPFMPAMVGYSRLSAKIWKLVDYFEPAVIRELKLSDFEQLDAEITEWWESLPEVVRTPDTDKMETPVPSSKDYQMQRQRIWTRLRLNQVRIWLYTPVLHSALSIAENMAFAHRAVDVARKTLRILTHLNRETNQYKNSQIFYHQFLTSSIAVLFLASTHAPMQFSALCRQEFYMGLDLVKELSGKSWVSHRLWRTIRSLKKYAPKLGLADANPQQPQQPVPVHAPATTGAMPFANGTGTAPAPLPPFTSGTPAPGLSAPYDGGWSSLSDSASTPEDEFSGLRLQSEMSKIYEGYVGMMNVPGSMATPPPLDQSADTDMAYGSAFGFTGLGVEQNGNRAVGQGLGAEEGGGVYHHMKNMF